MEAFIKFVQAYEEGIIIITFIVMFIFLTIDLIYIMKKITYVQKSIKEITENVEAYMEVVCREEDGQQTVISKEEITLQAKRDKEEKENRIISAVLQEIFP